MDRRRSRQPGEGVPKLQAGAAATAGAARSQILGRLAAGPAERSSAQARTEAKLLRRVFERCHRHILEACALSSVPAEFLGALTANESGGNPNAARFEPAVYRHLKAVTAGQSPVYRGMKAEDLAAEVAEILHPKADKFHANYLTRWFGANHRKEIAACQDEALRELATSWGYTQIMGYHQVGRAGTVRDLLDPQFHYRRALELLAEFAHEYQLDVTREFEEMFRCWNTGQPYGKTFDPAYVEKGLRRMEIYRALIVAGEKASGSPSE